MNKVQSAYSQAKLELCGLHKAMRALKNQIYGLKNLTIEVDAKYIKGMLKNPDSIPSAPMNRWIANILNFNPKLVHVSATKFQAPDALSRRPLAKGEKPDYHPEDELDEKEDVLDVFPVLITPNKNRLAEILEYL